MKLNTKLGSIAFGAVILAGLVHFAWSLSETIRHSREIRLNDVRDLRGFFARHRELKEAYQIDRGSVPFYVAIPRVERGQAIPASRPPAYVFDSSGRLIDWSGETGEDPTFNRLWPRGQMTPIPPAKLRRIVEPSAPTNSSLTIPTGR